MDDPLDPPAGSGRLGVDVAGPLHDHDGGEVAGLVEPPPGRHVGDRVGAQHEESSRPAPASASSVSAVTDGRAALDLDRRGLDAVELRRPRPRRGRGDRRRGATTLAALLPRVAGDHEQHPVEARAAPASRSPPPRGRRARDRTCPRTRPAAPSPLIGPASLRARRVFTPAKHSRHLPS